MDGTPTPPKDFTQYYSQYKRRLNTLFPAPTPLNVESTVKDVEPELGFWGRVGDIAMRSTRLITNPISKTLDAAVAFDEAKDLEAQGKTAEALSKKYKAVEEVVASPFTGFFSDKPSNKDTWSDIIEKQKDVRNLNNPDYVDVENNVPLVEKALVGGAADIILDPLWLLPPAKVIKTAVTARKAAEGLRTVEEVAKNVGVAKKQARKISDVLSQNLRAGAKTKATAAGVRAADEAIPGARTAEEAEARLTMDKLTPVADNVPVAQLDNAVSDTVAKATAAGRSASDDVIDVINKKLDDKALAADNKLFKTTSQRRELSSLLTGLVRGAKRDLAAAKKAPVAVNAAKPLIKSVNEWVDEVAVRMDNGSLPAGGIKEVIKFQGKPLPIATFRELISYYKTTTNVVEKDFLRKQYLAKAYDKYAQAHRNNPAIDLLGRKVETPVVESVQASYAELLSARIKNLSGQAYQKAEILLTKPVVDTLRRTNPEKLAILVDDINAILKEAGNIKNIDNIQSNKSDVRVRVLGLFGVTQDEFKLARARQITSNRVDEAPIRASRDLEEKVANVSQDARVDAALADGLSARGLSEDVLVAQYQMDEAKLKEIVTFIFEKFFRENFDPKMLNKKFKALRTTKGVRRTAPEYGLGEGLVDWYYNTHKQWTLFKMLNKEFSKYLKDQKFGVPLARKKRDMTLLAMEVSERIIDDFGIPVVIDINGVTSHIRFTQIYRELEKALSTIPGGDDWLLAAVFNGDTPAAITKLIDAVTTAMSGESRQNVLRTLLSKERRNPTKVRTTDEAMGLTDDYAKVEKIPNWLSDGKPGIFGHYVNRPKEGLPKGMAFAPNPKAAGKFYRTVDPRQAAEVLADAIMKSVDELVEVSTRQGEDWLLRVESETESLLGAGASELLDLMNTPGRLPEVIELMLKSRQRIDEFGNAIDASFSARRIAADAMEASIPETVRKSARAAKGTAKAAATGKGLTEARQAGYETAEDFVKQARQSEKEFADDYLDNGIKSNDLPPEAIRETVEETVFYDLSPAWGKAAKDSYSFFGIKMMMNLDPVSKFFSRTYGMGTKTHLWASRLFNSIPKLSASWSGSKLKALQKITNNKEYTPQVLSKAMQNLQRGITVEGSSAVARAQNDLGGIIFDVVGREGNTTDGILGNIFLRTGAGLEYLDDILRNYIGRNGDNIVSTKGDTLFDLARAQADFDAGKYASLQEAAFAQWKEWNIKDPTLFAGNLTIAASRVAADLAFVDSFTFRAIKEGFASYTPKKGYVRITASGKTYYGNLMTQREIYFAPDVAEILQRIDEVARASTKFDGLFGKITHEYIDPIADTWKYNITVPRPGHHFRNLWGDETMTYVAEGPVGFISSGKKAWQTLYVRNNYKDVDMARGLNQMGIYTVPKGGDVIVTRNGGVPWSRSLTNDEIYQLAMQAGILPPPAVNEGFFTDSIVRTRFTKATEKLGAIFSFGLGARGGGTENVVMGISQYRDHYSRLKHFIQIIDKAQSGKPIIQTFDRSVYPQSFQEMVDLAATRVNKYHPDNSQLSPDEMKYLRRMFMFYGWSRGAVVALAEATMTAPARLTMFGKASYSAAEAMGINPHSVAYPYPEGQLFPSFFLEEVQGPQWEYDGKYYGVSPGIAPWDVANMFTGTPTEISMGSANPVFRLPLELITGTNLGTGSRIRDYSDQIDSAIPGVNYFSNISTYSVSGSIVSLLSGKGLDKQLQYDKGNKDFWDQVMSASNWVTGLGLRDYSRPSYLRFAQQELRDKMNPDTRGF